MQLPPLVAELFPGIAAFVIAGGAWLLAKWTKRNAMSSSRE